jgi:hypothetical protein
MMRIEAISESGHQVRRLISRDELTRLSGVELAALLFPDPSAADVASVNEFLAHYRNQ